MSKKAKKLLALLLFITVLLTSMPVTGFALTAEEALDCLSYEITDGEVTITDCDASASGEIVIPSTIDGYPVTSIGYRAFYYCSSLTSIIIPDSVTSIGTDSFCGCSSLTSIIIPDSVTSIGSWAFEFCSSLTSIAIPDSVTIIGYAVFCGCSSMTSITIGNSVTSIGDWAFEYCSSLTSIKIPDSVTNIGYEAFCGCSKLTSIILPDSIKRIGTDAFAGTGYYNDDSNWQEGGLYIGNHLISVDSEISGSFAIKDGTKTIADSAFGYADGSGDYIVSCTNLTSIDIPNSVTNIGKSAFYRCTGLKQITIPESVTEIGASAFLCCESLGKIIFDNKATMIGESAFHDTAYYNNSDNWEDNVLYIGNYLIDVKDQNLIVGTYKIKDGTTVIADGAFRNCKILTNLFIPSSIIGIGSLSFYNCESLKNIYYNGNISSWNDIKNNTISFHNRCIFFYEIKNNEVYLTDCLTSALSELTLPSSIGDYVVTVIDNEAFSYCTSLTNIVIPDSITRIGNSAFEYCYNLTSMEIPDSVTSIGDSAFADCSSLTSVTIPNSVTNIGSSAFENCSSLTSVTIPNSVTSIRESAFANCSNLTSVIIPNSITLFEDYAFYGCSSLKSITIPNSVTSIGARAFEHCSSLTSITIPDSVTSIGDIAFSYCNSLQSITIPDGITSVDNYTFYYCISLASITIPDSVTSIGDSAFYYCSSLNSITIPESVKSIGDYAFFSCQNINKVTIPATVTQIGNYAFGYVGGYYSFYDGGGRPPERKSDFKIYCYSGTAGEKYAIDNGFDYELLDDSEPATVIDEKSGVKLEIPSGTFDGDVTLKVEEVLSGSSFDIIGKVNGKSKTKVFTIETYVDGQSVQPNGDVTVRIPVPDGFNAEKCKLYYLNTSSKNPEEIAFKIEDGYIVFTTNHFSDWAIIQTADKPTVSVNDMELNYKKSAALNPNVTVDENASYTVTYTSSNPSVARVDENGKVYGAKKGSADITVTVTDEYGNTVSDTCKINVTYAWWQWIIKIVLFGWIWY